MASADVAWRPRRSVLYMPAANERALAKAKSIDADALIFDLEDAVAPDAKQAARNQAVAAVSGGGYGRREVTVRVNSLDTPWGADDVAAAASAAPDAVVVPKVESPATLDAVSKLLDTHGAPPSLAIWAMAETPRAIIAADAIAAHPRVAALVMGTNDLAAELRATITADREALVPHLAAALRAARAHGVVALDGVHNDIADAEGFVRLCRQGAEMGFDGKTLIHPSQVEPANVAFAPSDDELDFHRRVIAALGEATEAGAGVVTVDGKMIENLHVEAAKRALAMAEAVSGS